MLVLKEGILAEIEKLGGHIGLGRLVEGLDTQLEGMDLAAPSSENTKREGGNGSGTSGVLDWI